MVTPTVRALELLEKLAEERSKLIEEKLIADQVIESLRRTNEPTNDENTAPSVDGNKGWCIFNI